MVYLVQSQPELSIWISKTLMILTTVAIEIDRSIHSALEHCPPTIICMSPCHSMFGMLADCLVGWCRRHW